MDSHGLNAAAEKAVEEVEKTFPDATPDLLKPNGESDGEKAPSTSDVGDAASAEKAIEPETPKPPRDVTGFAWALAVSSILATTFLFALDNTITADVQPAIIHRFGSITKLPWLSAAFFLAAAGTNLFWGRMFAQFDAKILYLITVFIFEVGSAVCGATPTMDGLIVGRALAGFGGAGMYCGVLTLLSVSTTEHERPTYIGLTGVTWGLGTVLGPIIGGAFTDSSAGWRWSFYINLCVGAAFVPAWFLLLPRADPRPGVAMKARFKEIDYLGTLLIIGAFVAGVMAIAFGGIIYAWSSARIIALFCTSGVLFILFGLQQTFTIFTTEDQRIFPVEFLKKPIMILLFIEMASASTAAFIPIYFIPLFFQFVDNDSALEAGVRLLPYVFMLVLFCVANGGIMSATGYYMPWYLGGAILTVIGSALMYTVDIHSSTSRIYGYSVLIGIGAGGFIQASYSVAQGKVEPRYIPLAIGFITMAQIGGATIGLVIANSVFLNRATHTISTILPNLPRGQIQGAVSGAGSDIIRNLDPDTKRKVIEAIVSAIDKTYILGITAGALAAVLALFMKREKLFMVAGAAG